MSNAYFVQGAGVLSRLEASGHVDLTDPRVLVIHADEIPVRFSRSPKTTYGRTGKRTGRELAIEAICTSATSADELFASFRREAAL